MKPLHAFDGYGIELEYMIVDRDTLAVRPIADRLVGVEGEVSRGHYAWSNEVVLHVIELKNAVPDANLAPLSRGLQAEVRAINAALAEHNACLMPTAMHPFMNPLLETRLWPHRHAEIYRAYDRIFDCRRHGWANLQSMHVNLPFSGDAEFTRLHMAIRLILPILPALAASSPFQEGRFSGFLDTRMRHYRRHQIKVPRTILGVIPEPVTGIADYRENVLEKMYTAIAPFDPENVLRHEWLNARGVIPRFARNALEIRVIDMQECPRADLAIAAAASAAIEALYDADTDLAFDTERLVAIFLDCIRHGEKALIDDADYLARLDCPEYRLSAADLWRSLIERHLKHDPAYRQHWQAPLATILTEGTLARRLIAAAGREPDAARLKAVYRELCACLQEDRQFGGRHDQAA